MNELAEWATASPFSFDGTLPSRLQVYSRGLTESQDGDHTMTQTAASETLTVTVNEVNVAPVLNTIGDQTVELTFTATASDTDVVDNLVNTLTQHSHQVLHHVRCIHVDPDTNGSGDRRQPDRF